MDNPLPTGDIVTKDISFTASTPGFMGDPDTKTELDPNGAGKKILWSVNDKISIFYGPSGANNVFTSENTEPVSSATFTGSITAFTGSNESGVAHSFWGIYPFSSGNTCDGESVTTFVKSSLKGYPNDIEKGTLVTVAKSYGLNLSFKNACSGFKLSFKTAGITKVIVKSNDGTSIAGTMSIGMDSDGLPEVLNVTNGSNSIVMDLSDNPSEIGKFYYIPMIPVTLTGGFTIELYKDMEIGTYTTTKSVSFTRSNWLSFGDVDNYVTWESNDYIILYSSLNERIIHPYPVYDEDAEEWIYPDFGANIVSNTYKNGCGVIEFDGPVTQLGKNALRENYNLKSIILPESVTKVENGAFAQCCNLERIELKAETAPVVSSGAFRDIKRYGTLIYPVQSDYSSWLSSDNQMLGAYEWNEIRPVISDPLSSDSEIRYVATSKQTLNLDLSEQIRPSYETKPLVMSIDEHEYRNIQYYNGFGYGRIKFSADTQTTGQVLKNTNALAVGRSGFFPTMELYDEEGFHPSIPDYFYGSTVERVNLSAEPFYGQSCLSYNYTIGGLNYVRLGTVVANDYYEAEYNYRCNTILCPVGVDCLDIDRVVSFIPGGSTIMVLTSSEVRVPDDMTFYFRRPQGCTKEEFERQDWSSSWWGSSRPVTILSGSNVTVKMLPDDIDKTNLMAGQHSYYGFYIIAKAGDTMSISSTHGDEDHWSNFEGYIGNIGENKWIERSGEYITVESSYTFNNDYEGWVSFACSSAGEPNRIPSGVIVLGVSNSPVVGIHTAFEYREGILYSPNIFR